jgi:hypothetical protein
MAAREISPQSSARTVTTPLWAVQPTPDTPLDSVDTLASFYFENIKGLDLGSSDAITYVGQQ